MKDKIFRFFWVIILVICAFTLGYTLKPTGNRRPKAFGPAGMSSAMRGNMKAPPLNFQRRR